MDPKVLGIIRELGLVFFLSIVGLNYGYGAVAALTGSGITLALVSLFVGAVSIMVGFLVGRYLFKLNWIMLSGADLRRYDLHARSGRCDPTRSAVMTRCRLRRDLPVCPVRHWSSLRSY